MKPAAFLMVLSLPFVPQAWADDIPTEPAPAAIADDLQEARALIKRQEYRKAIPRLEAAARRSPGNADVFNLLGFCYRKSGDVDKALVQYKEALRLNPKHRGAHEYMGEAYLMKKDIAAAEDHLKALEGICGKGCEEYRDLAKSISVAKGSAR